MPADNNTHPELHGSCPRDSLATMSHLFEIYLRLIHGHQSDPNLAVFHIPRCVPAPSTVTGPADREDISEAATRNKIHAALSALEQGDLDNEDVRWFIAVTDRILTATQEEISELRNHLPWKHWKTYTGWKMAHRRELQLEVVDLLHFVLNLASLTGMDGAQLAGLFKEKVEVNRRRWDGGY